MRFVAIVMGIWLILITDPFQFSGTSLDENFHELDSTISCEDFEMNGDFDLEFKHSKPFLIWGSKTQVPINFKNLHIETESISINGRLLYSKDRKIRIEAQESKPRLYIFKEPNILAHEIYISGVSAATRDAKIDFLTIAGESHVSIGKNSIIHLENMYSNSGEWIIEIDGRFQVIGDEDYEVVESGRIKFSGSLQIESPELPNSNSLRLSFDFSYHVEKLQLKEGCVLFKSRGDSPPNKFMAESDGSINKDEVIEDNFRIDMNRGFYQTERFLREFLVENIYEMKVHSIKPIESRLSIESHIKYIGKTLFPKIEVITSYYLLNKDNVVEDVQIKTSNLEANDKNTVTFLNGRNYMIEICLEKLVNDDVIINFTHRNFQEDITRNDIAAGFPYPHQFKCQTPSFNKQPIKCFTEFSYKKRDEEGPFIEGKTEGFYASIQSEISFRIEDTREEIPEIIKENDILSILKRFTLESEISDSVEIYIFFDLEKGFKMERFEYYPRRFSKKDDHIDVKIDLKAPFIGDKERVYDIKIFLMYRMNESTGYNLYLPDPTIEATIVEKITVKKGFQSYISGWIPVMISVLFSGFFSYVLQCKVFSGEKFEDNINCFLKNHITEDEIKIRIIRYVVKALILVAMFIIIFILIAAILFYIPKI